MVSTEYAPENIGFFETCLGLLTAPGQTTEILFTNERPRHVVKLITLLMISVFGPIVWHVARYGFVVYRADVLLALLFIFAFTFLSFIFCEALFLRVFAVPAKIEQVIAIVVYSSVPMTMFFVFVYLANFYYNGSLSLVDVIMKGYLPTNDNFLRVLPFAWAVSHISALTVFFYAIRSVGGTHPITGLMLAVLSIAPLYAALIIGLGVAEMAIPGAFRLFQAVLINPDTFLYFKK